MPNWVSNQLMFSGQPDKIEAVVNLIKSDLENDNFNLLKLLPLPEKAPARFAKIDKKFKPDPKSDLPTWYQANWYDYNIERFGCKWINLTDIDYGIDYDYIEINFMSPWSPLDKNCIEELANKYQLRVQNNFQDHENMEYYGLTISDFAYQKTQHYYDNFAFKIDADEDDERYDEQYDEKVDLFYESAHKFVNEKVVLYDKLYGFKATKVNKEQKSKVTTNNRS